MPAKPLPRVSVCLLTYKRPHVLGRTLEQLLQQTHADFELVINDDCSPDATERICRAAAARDARIRYHRNRTNLRYANNQNAAICRANCEYVAIVHDGDLYYPTLLEHWTRALEAHPSAALVFSGAESIDRSSAIVRQLRPYPPLVPGLALFDEILSLPGSPIFGIAMVRKSHLLAAGPFDPRLPTLADVDMWLRLLLRHDAAYVNQALYRIAPREVEHPNTFRNWQVRAEHELIFSLNHRRRYPLPSAASARTRSQIRGMLWRARIAGLLQCAKHGEARALLRGLEFSLRSPPLSAAHEPDSVLDWAGFEHGSWAP